MGLMGACAAPWARSPSSGGAALQRFTSASRWAFAAGSSTSLARSIQLTGPRSRSRRSSGLNGDGSINGGQSPGLTLVLLHGLTASGRSRGRSEWPDDPGKDAPMRLPTMLRVRHLDRSSASTPASGHDAARRPRLLHEGSLHTGLRGTGDETENSVLGSPSNWDTPSYASVTAYCATSPSGALKTFPATWRRQSPQGGKVCGHRGPMKHGSTDRLSSRPMATGG